MTNFFLNSPRRKDLLKANGFDFEVIVSDYEESNFTLDPILTAKTFAKEKVLDVYKSLENKGNVVVVGADMVVFCDGKILGKPKDYQDAFKMLKNLSGRKHQVVTSIAVIDTATKSEKVVSVTSIVEFAELSDEQIKFYIDNYKPFDKAGAYGIQEMPEGYIKVLRVVLIILLAYAQKLL